MPPQSKVEDASREFWNCVCSQRPPIETQDLSRCLHLLFRRARFRYQSCRLSVTSTYLCVLCEATFTWMYLAVCHDVHVKCHTSGACVGNMRHRRCSMCWAGLSAEQFAVVNFVMRSISRERRGLNPGSADKTLNMKIRHGRMGSTRSGACGLIWLNTWKLPRMWHSKDWQIDISLLIRWIAWCMAVLHWWRHLSGSSRLCACNEKEREKGKERERREKQIIITAGPFCGIISNYSHRRASARELVLHYITVRPSPRIRHVILFARMVHEWKHAILHVGNTAKIENWDCFKTPILQEILRIRHPLHVEHCVFSEAIRLFQSAGCSTESKIISMDARLRLDGIPALDLWDPIVAVLHGNTYQRNEELRDPCTNLVCAARHKVPTRKSNLMEWSMF